MRRQVTPWRFPPRMHRVELERIQSLLERYRHAQLLAALTLLLIVDPFLTGLVRPVLLDLVLALTLISAIIACATRRRHIVIGVSMTLCMLVATLFRSAEGTEIPDIAMSLFAICFLPT